MIGLIIVGVVVLIAFWLFTCYNSLVRGKNKCEEAFSTMDVFLKKRFDLIPNVVATVKGYAKHEAETLEKVIAARSGNPASTTEEMIEGEKQISSALSRINIVAEQYPELKANENFLGLQKQLSEMENDIANSRKYYNGCVRQFNDKIMTIPTNIIAGICKFKKQPFFEVEEAAERKNVKVEF